MEKLSFKLALKKVPVELLDEQNNPMTYSLKEFNSQQRELFMNGMRERMTGSGEEATITNFEGMHASLLTKCLYDPDDKLVTIEVLNTWPATVVGDLFTAGQTLNGLNKKAKAEAKNDSKVSNESGSSSPTDSESQSSD